MYRLFLYIFKKMWHVMSIWIAAYEPIWLIDGLDCKILDLIFHVILTDLENCGLTWVRVKLAYFL